MYRPCLVIQNTIDMALIEGVKKGQKTACTLLVCPLGNILAADSDYRMPRVESKCNRRENCLPNMGSLIFYLSGPSNFCLPAISLFDIFIKQDNSCKLLRQESRHNNRIFLSLTFGHDSSFLRCIAEILSTWRNETPAKRNKNWNCVKIVFRPKNYKGSVDYISIHTMA